MPGSSASAWTNGAILIASGRVPNTVNVFKGRSDCMLISPPHFPISRNGSDFALYKCASQYWRQYYTEHQPDVIKAAPSRPNPTAGNPKTIDVLLPKKPFMRVRYSSTTKFSRRRLDNFSPLVET